MRAFSNEWIFAAFDEEPSFVTRPMFSGLAAYVFGRMMLVLVEPSKTGRWEWHGVLVCTDFDRQVAIQAEFPRLAPHDALKKWLYIDSHDEHFTTTITGVAGAIARNDERFGIEPGARRRSSARTRRVR